MCRKCGNSFRLRNSLFDYVYSNVCKFTSRETTLKSLKLEFPVIVNKNTGKVDPSSNEDIAAFPRSRLASYAVYP